MPSKALVYAENSLGVHEIFNQANAAQAQAIDSHAKLIGIRANKRRLTEEILDREVEIWKGIRNRQPELSATALDAEAKRERRTDQIMRDLRKNLSAEQIAEDWAEKDVREAENAIKIYSARMYELGGYFNYLSVVKEVDSATKQTQQT